MAIGALAADAPPAPVRPPLWRELVVGLLVFACYAVVAAMRWPGRVAMATRYSVDLYNLEKALHIDIEKPLNIWLAARPVLRTLANYEYAITYIVTAFGLLFWMYVRRPDAYRWARTSFIILNLIAICCFAVYPLAPPRLVPELGFIDTVRQGRTVGSWGSPLIAGANELAAMPSLHIGWSLWVSVILAYIGSGMLAQGASAAHVLLTTYVIMATANHYLLDAVGGVLAVWLAVAVLKVFSDRPGCRHGPRVAPADAFFLHAESPAAPQQVGGLIMLDAANGVPEPAALRGLVRSRLSRLPRFRQRLSGPSRWRRARWMPVSELDIDWDWHLPVRDVSRPDGRPGGLAALHSLVAGITATPLPRDRPLWRFFTVHGVLPDRAAGVLLVHHVLADGLGTVAQAAKLLEPPMPAPAAANGGLPGRLKIAAATVLGIGQLATDGTPAYRLDGAGRPQRRYATADLPLADVRALAHRHGSRVTDVLLSCVAGGLIRTRPDLAGVELRTAVPLTVRRPDTAGEGNLTAAVMVDLPLSAVPEVQRLAEVTRRNVPLLTGSRALAARFVMDSVGALLPPVVHAWFARTVYGGRFFQAIVSNMPGSPVRLRLLDTPLTAAYPILPLAPRAPLAVGGLSWDGTFHLGISAEPALVPDAQALSAAVCAAFAELSGAAPSTTRVDRPDREGDRPQGWLTGRGPTGSRPTGKVADGVAAGDGVAVGDGVAAGDGVADGGAGGTTTGGTAAGAGGAAAPPG